ncbi:activating signal cointegrator 1 complex subunit, variant 2 [Basidiobolus ranarum]|uniref:Activating signal cointegrator 1 complex subunit, variant 2 n=1 Tax=Basidiobolus ranarum TaxID=34480 RepID=A0ABR2W671_9FUNG
MRNIIGLKKGKEDAPVSGKTSLDELNFETIKVQVPKAMFGILIGKRGANLIKLRSETGAKILIPKLEESSDFITITGTTESVNQAKKRVEEIIEEALEKLPPTHFLMFSLPDTYLHKKVIDFRDQIKGLRANDVDPNMFTHVHSLHITIGMLRLISPEDILAAGKILKELTESVNDCVKDRSLLIRLAGLAIMDSSSENTNVLYARVEEVEADGRLMSLIDLLRARFKEAGYLVDTHSTFKIHVTLINSKYASTDERKSFDSTLILRQFGDTDFGSVKLPDIRLAKRALDRNMEYICESKISLP